MVAGRRVVRIIEGFEGYGSEMERLEASEKKMVRLTLIQ